MKDFVKKICVRTSIEDIDGSKVNQGSGVIINNNNSYFVITTYHCIIGEFDEYLAFDKSKIWVESQEDYKSPFTRIKVIEIKESNKGEDWIILKVEVPEINIDFTKIKLGKHFLEENVYFAGVQQLNENSSRLFNGRIIDIATKEFKTKLEGDTLQQGSEEGSLIAKGLSGSGVFIIRATEIYLIGLLKNVIGEIALNNDIECCPVILLDSYLTEKCLDLGKLAISGEWESATEKQCTEEDIEIWININDDNFNKLLRKNRVLYPEDQAQKVTRDRILSFLEQEYTNDNIRKKGSLITQYEDTAKVFEESVKINYTRSVSDRNEAKIY
jgi:hypothetical protein